MTEGLGITEYYTRIDLIYRAFIKYCVFLNSARSAEALLIYLPVVCTHTDIKGKQRKARVRNVFLKIGKNTIFNEHPVAHHAPIAPLGALVEIRDVIYSNAQF